MSHTEVSGDKDAIVDVALAAVDDEQDVSYLRRKRSAAKGILTKKIKELTQWRMQCQSLSEAKLKITEFEDCVSKFQYAHAKYHVMMKEDYEIADSLEYFESEERRIANFFRTLNEWIRSYEIEDQPIDQAEKQAH